MARKRVTLEEVAARAGVSTATVSRVLNNHPQVFKTTRETVLAALRELGGTKPVPRLVGLVLPDTSNPFFPALALAFDKECERKGAVLVISSSDSRADRELNIVEQFKDFGVAGFIFISAGHSTDALLTYLARGNTTPVVLFDRRMGFANLDFVAVDSKAGTEQAVDHLAVLGHRRIAYLKGLDGTETARDRFESFITAMARNRLEVNPEWMFVGDYQAGSGRKCAELIEGIRKEDRPTALMVANDLMALAAMQRLQQLGWKLPEELSVVGFDGLPMCEWVHPTLTTIVQPINKLVHDAVRVLYERIDEIETGVVRKPVQEIEIRPQFVPRDSVTRPWHAASGLQLVTHSGAT